MSGRKVRRGGRHHISAPRVQRPTQPPTKRRQVPLKLFGILAAASSIALIWWYGLAIRSIQVEESQYHAEITTELSAIMNSPWWQKNLFWFPSASAEAALETAFDDKIAEASVRKKWWPPSLVVTAIDRTAVIGWQTGGQFFGIDQKGVVTGYLSPQSGLPQLVDQTNLPVAPGDTIAREEFVKFVIILYRRLPEATGLSIERGRVAETTNELIIDTNRGYFLRFDTTLDIELQLSNLNALIKGAGVSPKEYIDLRLPHKAYYR